MDFDDPASESHRKDMSAAGARDVLIYCSDYELIETTQQNPSGS
ncbi:hypothetical protein ACFFWD_10425 [Bradyrhizobium erythrophlei]